jgi:YD repeat-containing protein
MTTSGVTYIYDELGRLTSVVEPSGDTGIYTYDAVGNLLSIERRSSSVVSIIEFTPKSAPVGTSVTIHGTGFSETPGENAVTFNGIPAPVVSATVTRIVTAAPSGAGSGLITVTTPTGSATSSIVFIVTGAPEVPVIAGFTPTIGVPGTGVRITGRNFDTTRANNKAMFNGVLAILNAATTTAIETAVPPGPGSGRVAVSTPQGKVASTEDFFIPPSPHTIEDVGFTGRIGLGASVAITVGAPNKIGLIVVDATAGRRISLAVSGLSFGGGTPLVEISVLGPLVQTLANRLATKLVGRPDDIDMEPLPDTGTYTIVVAPLALTASLTLTVSEPVTGAIEIDGRSLPVSLDKPGQDARVTFDGLEGQRVSLGISGVSFGTGAGLVAVSILLPDGTTLASKLAGGLGDDIDTEPLPETGTYTIIVDPQEAKTVSLTLTLSEPVTGAIAIDGLSVPVIIDKPGQDALVTFEGTAEQRVDLGVSDVSFGTGAGAVDVTILHPDGSTLLSNFVLSKGRSIHTDPLPDTGTYTIVVDPQDAKTVSLTLTLSEPLTGALTIGGPSMPVTLRPGQQARLTFEGTAGRRASLGVTEVSFGTGHNVLISILKPDETALVSTTIGTSGGDLDTGPLADTGTHTIVGDPVGSFFDPVPTTANLTLILSEPVSGAITIDGSSVPITLDRPGQNARLTFEGTAGQRVRLRVSEASFETSFASVIVSILNPEEATLASKTIDVSGGDIDTGPLPATGIYTVVVNPRQTKTASLTLTLAQVVP